MKKTTLIVSLLISCLSLIAQSEVVVKGVVVDSVNKTPLPFVALFFEGTSQGDITNSGGEFKITTSVDVITNRQLKVMFTGYTTQQIDLDFNNQLPIKIYLSPITKKEDDVAVLEVIRKMGDEGRKPYLLYLYELINMVIDDYIPLGNRESNKVDLYNVQQFPAYNHLEGVRLRLSAATNTRLHPQLFGKTSIGYGFKDKKLKYRGELAWAFNEKAYDENEFPRNNLKLIHDYNIFSPGENNPRSPNNFLLLSYRRSLGTMTYRRFTELNYEKETLYGLSYMLWARMSEIKSASELTYLAIDRNMYPTSLAALKSKDVGIALRFWPHEAYIQNKRNRSPFSLSYPLFFLSHTVGENSIFGGNDVYHKTEFSLQRRFILGDYGFIDFVGDYQKIWTKAPFPLLLFPNANNLFFVDNKAFFLPRAMEFINDEQYTLKATYVANKLLLYRIPLLNKLGFRELFILRGVQGNLSNKNIPTTDNGLFMLPAQTITMTKKPYVEGVIGITNILGVLRVEYIHRLTYRNHPDVLKYGFRFDATF